MPLLFYMLAFFSKVPCMQFNLILLLLQLSVHLAVRMVEHVLCQTLVPVLVVFKDQPVAVVSMQALVIHPG